MVARGSKLEYDQLKGTEVMEFFRVLKVFQKNLEKEAKRLKEKGGTKHGKDIT